MPCRNLFTISVGDRKLARGMAMPVLINNLTRSMTKIALIDILQLHKRIWKGAGEKGIYRAVIRQNI